MNASRTLTVQLVLSVGELIQALQASNRDIDIQALPSTGSGVEVTMGGSRNIVLTYIRPSDYRAVRREELDPA